MAYIYNLKITGANLALPVGNINNTSTTLSLLGRNYNNTTTANVGNNTTAVYGFGHYINQNFIDLLQHGAKTKTEWQAVTSNLIQGQLVAVTEQSQPTRYNRLYMAGSGNKTFSDALANYTHSNGGLIEVYTEANPPANMIGYVGNLGVTTDLTIDYANNGNIYANIANIANIAEFSTSGLKLGATGTSSNLTLANGNLSVTGTATISGVVTLNDIVSTTNTISVKSNTVTISRTDGASGSANNQANVTIYGNVTLSDLNSPRTTTLADRVLSAPYVYGTLANLSTGLPVEMDQIYIKNTGVLESLNVGSDPANGYSGNANLANIKMSSNGEIRVRSGANIDLTVRYANGNPIPDNANGGANTYGYFIGDGSKLVNIPANAIAGGGSVSNADYATYAGTLLTNAQPNITSVGTLSSLTVNSNSSISLTGNISVTGNMVVSSRLIADILVANTFAPDTVNASVGIRSPAFTTGSNTTTGYLNGRFVTTDGSLINMAVNDSPLFIKTITTGNGGNTGNFYAGGTGGGWTFDNRLTLLRGLTFDDGAGNTSTLTSTGANVNLFTSSLTAINLGTNASNVYIGGSTSGDRVRIGNDLRVIGNISVDGDIGATVTAANLMNTVTKTLYFASAANVISMGASTGNTTINHNLIVASDITANANIVTSQATFSIDGSSTTTMLIGGNATSVSIGNTTGTTTVNHDLTVNGGDLLSSQTTFNIANTTSTTVNFAGAATAVNIGASTGTLTLNNPTVVGTNTTQNVFNTVATTLNFAGAATTLNVGKSNSTLNLLSNVIAGSALQTTVDLWNTDTTTVNFAGAADTISIGNIASTAGNTTINHGLVVTGKAWFNDRVTFTDFNNTVTTINSATGTVAHDTSTATTFYHNTPTANFVPNFTNVSTTASRSTVVTLIVPQGGTARVPTAVQVNGSSQTVKWLGGASPTGNASKTDVFYFTLLYVGGTWTVLGQYSFYA